jgi:hypothetical protein
MLLLVLLGGGWPGSHVLAQDGFSYTYLEGGYQNVDLDSPSADGDGIFLGGSVELARSVFLTADLDYADFNRGIDARTLELGVGVSLPVAPDLDGLLKGGYIDAEVDTRFGDFEDDGFFIAGGARWMVTEQVELNGSLKYVDLDESGDDVVVAFGGLVTVRPNLAVLGGVEFADNADTLTIGFRYYLGR